MDWGIVTIFVLANLAAASTGALFRPGEWYRRLDKPSWTPPNLAFPIAWTILYAMIAASGAIFTAAAEPGERLVPLAAYALQLVLNAAWSALFFGARRMDLARIDIVVMLFAIAATMVLFWPVSPLAAGLLAPYFIWVGFASYLNHTILRRNDPRLRAAKMAGTAG